jgi:hypothetical protein
MIPLDHKKRAKKETCDSNQQFNPRRNGAMR